MMMKVLCFTMVFMIVSIPYTEAITCSEVFDHFMQCTHYLSRGGVVPTSCCNDVKGLITDTKTTSDRQATCLCINNAYKAFQGWINRDHAVSLPGKCGVDIPYMSPNTDCNKYVKSVYF